jgi:hypothetical protein
MEGLIELVAASFARHGIECPSPMERRASTPVQTEKQTGTAAEPTALPDHNYRKESQPDPAR